jgi:hypothetical protein
MDLKSGNPALSVKTFDGLDESADPMTLSGTINKAAIHCQPCSSCLCRIGLRINLDHLWAKLMFLH